MRIAILVHKLTDGGAERVAALWANGFAERGHQVMVVTYDDKSPVAYTLLKRVCVRCVASNKKYGIFRILERMRKLRMLLRREKPNVVIDVMPSFERIVPRMWLDCFNVSTEHNSFERPNNAEHKLNRFKKYWLNRLYDHVTVLTQADKDVIGNRLKHVTVLPNPLALEPVKIVPPKEKIVLAVGRKEVWHYKGFDILIKAWSKVSADAEGWRLQIVGGGTKDGQNYLERLCMEFSVTDSVEFIDFQSHISPYYQRAEIFVLSSRYEGFGMVLLEAMSQGCACIACDYKGRQSEIVTNGKDGVTCQPDNVTELANAILLLIGDDERRFELQNNAIRRANDFSLEHIIDYWERIFKKEELL